MEANQQIAADASARAQQIHLGSLPKKSVHRDLQTLMAPMLPPAIRGHARRKIMQAWFGNRVTYGAIRHWLKGRRSPPAWARKILQTIVHERQLQLAHIAAMLAQKEKGAD